MRSVQLLLWLVLEEAGARIAVHFVTYTPRAPGNVNCRNAGWGGPPHQAGRPLKRRAGRSPSPSGSFSGSYSSYSSSGSDASRPPAAAPPVGMLASAMLVLMVNGSCKQL